MSLEEKYPRLTEIEDFNLKHVIACVLTSKGVVAESGLVSELAHAVEEFYDPTPEPEPEPAPPAPPEPPVPTPEPVPQPEPPAPAAEPGA